MRILVCGGRDFGHVVRTKPEIKDEPPEVQKSLREYSFIHNELSKLICAWSRNYTEIDNWLPLDITIIAGGAKGADSAAIDFAVCSFCDFEEYKADWKKHGRSAGPIRNQRMLDEGKPDLVVAFPGGKGTAHMVKIAKAAKIKVLEIKYAEG